MHQLKRLTALAGIALAAAACTDVPYGGITAPVGARPVYYELGAAKVPVEQQIMAQIACLYANAGGKGKQTEAEKKRSDFQRIIDLAGKSPSGSDPVIVQSVKDHTNLLVKAVQDNVAADRLGSALVCGGQTVEVAAQILYNLLFLYSGQYEEILSGDGQTSKVCLPGENCAVTTLDPTTGVGAILLIPEGSFLFPVLAIIDFNATCPDGYLAFGTPTSPCVDFSVAGDFIPAKDITRAVCDREGDGLLRYNEETGEWELLEGVVLVGYEDYCEHPLEDLQAFFTSRAPSNPVLAFASRVAAYLGEVLGPKVLHAIDKPPLGGIGPRMSPHIGVKLAIADTGLDALCQKTHGYSPSTANAACTHLYRAAQCAENNDGCWNGALGSFIGVVEAQTEKGNPNSDNYLDEDEANDLICDANALKRPSVEYAGCPTD